MTASYAEKVAMGLEILRGILPFAPPSISPEIAMVWARYLADAGVEEDRLKTVFDKAGRTMDRFPAPVQIIRLANDTRPPMVFDFSKALPPPSGPATHPVPQVPALRVVYADEGDFEARKRAMIRAAKDPSE